MNLQSHLRGSPPSGGDGDPGELTRMHLHRERKPLTAADPRLHEGVAPARAARPAKAATFSQRVNPDFSVAPGHAA
jgi:hypothetical protein